MHSRRSTFGRREFLGAMGATGAAAGLVLFGGNAADAAPATPTNRTAPAGPPAPAVVNGAFENGLTGWKTSGTAGAAHLDAGGRDGTGFRLTHWSETAYTATTSQQLTGLRPGWLTVGAWVKSGGALGTTSLRLSDPLPRSRGHASATHAAESHAAVTVPNTEQDDGWVYLVVSARICGRSATLSLTTRAPGGSWATIDDVTARYGKVSREIRGADLSSVPKNEDHGALYYTAQGRRRAPELILAAAGANVGRLKVWVDPADGYNDLAHVVTMARRIKRAGMQLLVDFHYSDTWTDPGHQAPPAAWKNFTAAQLTAAVHQHTLDVLGALRKRGIVADFVQVGNEINPGMLWPLGQTWDVDTTDSVTGAQWANLGAFLTAGATAVKKISPRTKVLLHLTNINNGIDSLTWWFDQAVAQQVPFDVIGLSYYSYWHGSLRDLQSAVTTLSSRYDRDVMILETAYPWTLEDNPNSPYANVIESAAELIPGYPATPAGQAANFRAIQDVVASAPGGRGLGTVYWEPAWTSVVGSGWDPTDPTTGDAWENQAVFDWKGRPLPAMAHFAPDPGGH
ncbi:arabinogalactan endo-1,4-beta-galactosidase [Nakamurella sp. UYEF19]|uniref:glycoside hydrolase family 53 protein n=1 Tax=Nakamurella sp. UYEF19 TaxID=1756392 RepID=UPI0033955022